MMKTFARIAMVILLCGCSGWAQAAQSATAPQSAPTASPDAALSGLLAQMQSAAERSDSDVTRLRVEKWKTDAAGRQQAQDNAAAIHRNLSNAVPELLQQVRAEPGSVTANFRLYRDLNVLYEAFAALAETAGAFGPGEQYTPLEADAARLDKLRHQLADRLDTLAGASDAELLRLRAQRAAAEEKTSAKAAPAPSKIVVDDSKPVAKKPAAKKKKKPAAKAKPSAANPKAASPQTKP